jgi:hypothetical protein
MSRRALEVPSYCLHRASGRAVVRLGGRDVYLGEYGSPESHEEYERVIADWRSGRYGRTVPPSHARRPADPEYAVLSVNQVILAFWKHAETYYVKDGKPTTELANFRVILSFPLVQREGGRSTLFERYREPSGKLRLKKARHLEMENGSLITGETIVGRPNSAGGSIVVCADWDGDGRNDLLGPVSGWHRTGSLFLLRNMGTATEAVF